MSREIAIPDLVETAVAGARAGGEILLESFRADGLEIRFKGNYDLVSKADHDSEARVIDVIHRRYPDHPILAEESGLRGDATGGGYDWLIDPLDGTANFLQGLPTFCVSVACRRRDELVAGAILDPLGQNLFTAGRGLGAYWNDRPIRVSQRRGLDGAFLATGYPFRARQALDLYLAVFRQVFLRARAIRRCGSAALDLAYTAAGVYDGFFEFRLSPWDFAAGTLLLREAGGTITDLDGGDGFFDGGNLIAGAPGVQRELLAVVREHVDEARLDAVDPARNNALQPAVD